MRINFTIKSTKWLGIFFLIIIPWLANAQTKITGTVTDERNNQLPGISIKQKGTKNGTATDADGNFSFTLNDGNKVLMITGVGYKSKEVSVEGKTTITIRLQEDNSNLDEVVALGYQNVQRKKTASAISTVKGKEFENTPYATFDAMLQGRVAGLTVLSTSGEPGSNNVVNVRGSTSVGGPDAISPPLYVIDGIIYDISNIGSAYGTSPLQAINPNDIESVDVLKDAAAAAVYGARASNGVIIIKTKRPAIGAPPQINISAYYGISDRPALRKITTGAAERRLKMDLLYGGGIPYNSLATLSPALTDSLNAAFNNNTDWQKPFIQSAAVNNIDANIASATDTYSYRFSVNRYYEQGVLKGYDLTRITPSLFFQVNPVKNLTVQTNLYVGLVKNKHGLGISTFSKYPFNLQNFPSSFLALSQSDIDTFNGQTDNVRDDDKTTSINGNTFVQYTIIPGLNVKSSISYNINNNTRSLFRPAQINDFGLNSVNGFVLQNNRWELENTINYAKSLKSGHNFNFLVLQGMEKEIKNDTYTNSIGNLDAIKTVGGVAAGPNLTASNFVQERTRLSWMGSLVYDYKGKYLLQGVLRVDGTSRFLKGQRWASFPSLSAGWLVSEENFFKSINKIISFLKLRASYGITGSEPSDFYPTYQTLNSNAGYFGVALGNGNTNIPPSTYNGTTVIYPNYNDPAIVTTISWQKAPQFNAGFDLAFLNDRFTITADYYIRNSTKQLFNSALPVTTGYAEITNNFVDLRNTGVELTISTRNFDQKSPFQWNINFNIAYNNNFITKLPNGGREFITGPDYLRQTLSLGEPLYSFKVFKVNGVYSRITDVPVDPLTGKRVTWFASSEFNAGDPARQDINGDYKIDYNDYVTLGSPQPKWIGGITNSFSYKRFTLDILTTFVAGRKLLNGYLSDQLQKAGNVNSPIEYGALAGPAVGLNFSDFWQKPGDIKKYPALLSNGNSVDKWFIAQSTFIEDASFIRLKNIRLGYTFPEKLSKRLGLRVIRVFGMADNIKVWTNANVPDPEAINPSGYANGNEYPVSKKLTFGFNATF